MISDTPGPGRGRWRVCRCAGTTAVLLLLLLLLPLAACAPATDSPAGAEQAPPPRITAEHPVTARPALEAGLLDGGATGGEPLLGEAGSVDGIGASLAAVLPAEDVAESIDFYVGLLGFDVTSSQPAEPPFQRVELTRDGVHLALLGPEAWEREMPRFGASAAARGGVAGGEGGGDEVETDEAEEDPAEEEGTEGDGAEGEGTESVAGDTGGGAGPVLRLTLEDLATVVEELAGAGVEMKARETGDAPDAPGVPGGPIAVVDPAGNRLLLVPAADS